MPYTTPVPGTTITAQYAIQNIRDQVVTPFPSAAARTSQITAPVEGMLTYLQDVPKRFEYHNGTTWVPLTPYRAIQTVTTPTQATILFSGIPTNLRELRITGTARCDVGAANADIGLLVNTDASAVYKWQHIFEQNNGVPASFNNISASLGKAGTVTGASASAGVFGTTEINFNGWNSPHTTFLAYRGYSGFVDTGATVVSTFVGTYAPAGPYTSITLQPTVGNWVQGTEFIVTGWY